MRRRRLLRAAGVPVAAGLAGCSELAGDTDTGPGGGDQRVEGPTSGSTPTDGPTTTRTPTDAPADGTTVSVVGTSPVREAPLEYEVSMRHASPTENHPPVLRTRITNTRDAATRLGEEREAQHQYVGSKDGTLLLLGYGGLGDRQYRIPADRGCWRLESPPPHLDYYGRLDLDPGETVTTDSPLYGSPSLAKDRCLPSGIYRFSPDVFWGDADGRPGGSSRRVDWGFTLRIE